MVMVKDIKSREGGRHWRTKQLLLNWINNGGCWFADTEGGKSLVISTNKMGWDYSCLEAFCLEDDTTIPYGYAPPIPISADCADIYHEMYDQEICEYFKEMDNKMSSIREMPDGEGKESFKDDPLNFCKYRQELEVRFIFDVALGREGHYEYVIEVVDKAPVKKDKKRFCYENGITLIEIQSDAVIKSKLIPRHFMAQIHYPKGFQTLGGRSSKVCECTPSEVKANRRKFMRDIKGVTTI